MAAAKPVIYPVLAQHAGEAAFLWMQRRAAVEAPNMQLHHLRRHDDRIEAHLDGVRLAGAAGEAVCAMQLAAGEPGAMFVAAVLAIANGAAGRLDELSSLCAGAPQLQSGFLAALGWSEAQSLRGIVARMLSSTDPWRRLAGIAACAMHRVDPGLVSARHLEDSDARVRARALRAAGELGRHEYVSRLLDWLADEDPTCQFWAAWSAVLLGDRNKAHDWLLGAASNAGPQRARAFQLALLSMKPDDAHSFLQQLARDADAIRWLILGSGFVGDARYVSWLIGQMSDDKLARVAGHAFSLITGLDMKALNLVRRRPAHFETGPTDDPNDPNVDSDADESLPWPDPAKVGTWWHAHSHRFDARVRYFMGEPLSRQNCLRVLQAGYQRQRIAASLYLCVLDSGTPLFEWRAPAWRQQRQLASDAFLPGDR